MTSQMALPPRPPPQRLFNQKKERHASWWWYGRYEGACGAYVPPYELVPRILYWLGNVVGRRFGPPATRVRR